MPVASPWPFQVPITGLDEPQAAKNREARTTEAARVRVFRRDFTVTVLRGRRLRPDDGHPGVTRK